MDKAFKLNKAKTILSIYLFFLIFNPPIYRGFSFTKAFIVLGALYLLFYIKETIKILKKCKLNKIIHIFIFSSIYYLIVILVNILINSNITISSYFFSLLEYIFYYFALLIVILSINIFCENNNLEFVDLIFCFIIAGIIQTVIVLACYLVIPIRTFFINLIINNSNSEVIRSSVYWNMNKRNFGWASSLYDIFGYSSAILVLLSFITGLFKKFRFLFLAIIMMIMPLLNARTGLLLSIIGITFSFFVYLKKHISRNVINKLSNVILIIILAFCAFIFIREKLLSSGSNSSNWIIAGVKETITFLSGKGIVSGGYYDSLINNFLIFPSFFEIIFGTGVTPMILIGKNTDVGYVQNIWKFGIIGSIIIYYLNYKIFKLAFKYSKNSHEKTIAMVMAIMFFIYLIKLNSLGYTQASVITFPILFKIIHDNNSMATDRH